jgi:hypothetical protein
MPVNKVFTCPNPRCRRKIKEPILLSDFSSTLGEHYYACPYCFMKLNLHAHAHTNLVGLSLTSLGSIILVGIYLLTWYDMTVWGKDIALIFFGSRTSEAISLGMDIRVIHYFLIGLVFLILGLGIFVRRRSQTLELHLSATPAQCTH